MFLRCFESFVWSVWGGKDTMLASPGKSSPAVHCSVRCQCFRRDACRDVW